MSAATQDWVNPDVLRWARRRLNLDLEQVAEESKKLARRFYSTVSTRQLEDWEGGKAEPGLEHLETLSEIYVCPLGYFFLEARPSEQLPVSFRGLSKGKEEIASLSQRALRRFSGLAHWTVELLRKTEQPWQVSIRPGQFSPQINNAERLAVEYRQRFGWTAEQRQKLAGNPREAFVWWRRRIESQGVFCFEMRLDPKDIRGAALWCEDYPFILVNHQDIEAAGGRIFTLLHEFGHLITAKEGLVCDFHEVHRDHNPEPFANRFAARMLVTPQELQHRLRELDEARYRANWSDSLLDKLRKPFFASRDVVAILLQEIRLAPSGFYDRKRRQWEKKKPWGRGGRRPPMNEQKLQEVGYSLAKALARSGPQPAFSWVDASSVLGMKVERAEAFLNWAQEHVK